MKMDNDSGSFNQAEQDLIKAAQRMAATVGNQTASAGDMESLLKEKKEKKKSIFRRIDWGWLVACLLFFTIAGLYAYDRYLVEKRLRVIESSSLALNNDRFSWISDNLTNHNDRINNLAGEVDVVRSAKDRIVVVPPCLLYTSPSPRDS